MMGMMADEGMFLVRDRVWIAAPVARCFALSTSLKIVEQVLKMHPAEAEYVRPDGVRVRMRTSGHVKDGDVVRWEGWKFGLPQLHVSLIRNFEENRFFQDVKIEGRFRDFEHDHAFYADAGGTWLQDEIRFSMWWGVAGRMLSRWVLRPYMQRVLGRRLRLIKRLAEGDEWREFV